MPPLFDVLLGQMAALLKEGRRSEAISVLRNAVDQGESNPEIVGNLGALLFESGQQQEGLGFVERAITHPDASAQQWINYGYCLKHVGRLHDALACLDRALLHAPDHARLRWHRALLRLLMGSDIATALDDYEWRWRVSDFPEPARNLPFPTWDGRWDRRSTLFVYAEQGFGDTLQFIRYLPLAARRVGRVILEVRHELLTLLEHQKQSGAAVVPPNVVVVARGAKVPVPDAQIALMSLPRALRAFDYANPPCRSPYLVAPGGVNVERDAAGNPQLLVGLVWNGRPTHPRDWMRSFKLDDCAPLFAVPGLRWLSLQLGPAAAALNGRTDLPLLEITDHLSDFLGTARIIRSLDLVITPDTAVAHLAAALGTPTWVPINPIPDWRWGMEGPTSAWYDAVRLFRQTSVGDWSPVFLSMAEALREIGGTGI